MWEHVVVPVLPLFWAHLVTAEGTDYQQRSLEEQPKRLRCCCYCCCCATGSRRLLLLLHTSGELLLLSVQSCAQLATAVKLGGSVGRFPKGGAVAIASPSSSR
jgi:hypothetical protein